MARVDVLLTDEQRQRLDRESAATGLSKSQVLAGLLDAYLALPRSERDAMHAAHDARNDRRPTTT